jgi:hypothetical protein
MLCSEVTDSDNCKGQIVVTVEEFYFSLPGCINSGERPSCTFMPILY